MSAPHYLEADEYQMLLIAIMPVFPAYFGGGTHLYAPTPISALQA